MSNTPPAKNCHLLSARSNNKEKEEKSRCGFLPTIRFQRKEVGSFKDSAETLSKDLLREVVQAKWPLHVPELDLAINTGLRKGSQYDLTWDMVDWRSRMLNISRTKNDEAVHVPLNDAAVAALKTVFDRGDGKGRVFRSGKTGEPLENARHWFDDAVVDAKLKNFHWHDLRHTFASRLRMKGAPLGDIADLLGHKSLTMTRRYAHLGSNRLHEVVSFLKATDTTTDTEQMAVSPTVVQVSVN
jgi:integrase